jgi:signal transduction histidine kinase
LENFGDLIVQKRKMVQDIHQKKKEIGGFEYGVFGISYRVLTPIFYKNEYIGAFEIGISPKKILDHVSFFNNLEGVIKFEGEGIKSIQYEKVKNKKLLHFIPLAEKQVENNSFRFEKKQMALYSFDVISYDQKVIGKFLFFNDLTNYHEAFYTVVSQLVFVGIIGFFVILAMLYYILHLYARGLEKAYKEVEVILDNQQNIVLLTNGTTLAQGNKKFFQFFGFEDLEDFLKSYHCICEFFVEEEGYLSIQMGDLNWTSYIVQNQKDTHLAKIIQNGEEHIFKVYGCIIDEDMEVGEDYIVVTFEDITQELIRQNDLKAKDILLQQQSRLAALGEMIGNIAHQWRQPLSVITAAVTGLQFKQEMKVQITQEMITKVTDTVIHQANYLSQTIDDFRDFIKNDTTKELFHLSKVIEDTIHLLEATLKANTIELILKLDDTIEYNGYKNQLSQVLMNIVNNAKDAFNEQNQTKKQIIIQTMQEANLIKIEIIDNAGGISEEIKGRIFDPYFTTKHKTQGTGLGLYICVNIIKKYFGGKIYIEDVIEKIEEDFYRGAKFVIEFESNKTIIDIDEDEQTL